MNVCLRFYPYQATGFQVVRLDDITSSPYLLVDVVQLFRLQQRFLTRICDFLRLVSFILLHYATSRCFSHLTGRGSNTLRTMLSRFYSRGLV